MDELNGEREIRVYVIAMANFLAAISNVYRFASAIEEQIVGAANSVELIVRDPGIGIR